MSNPLLDIFATPYGTAPFDKIKTEHFKPAIIEAIAIAKKEIAVIVNNPDEPNFENTIEALEFSGQQLERITAIFFNLNSAETSKEIQKIAREVSPLLTEFGNDILLDKALFEKVKKVYEAIDMLNLNTEQKTLLTKKYKSFYRNGANLSEKNKEILREIDKEMAALKLKFSENVLAETQAFELHITDKAELEGLASGDIMAAEELAKQRDKEGWIFTLDYPSYHAIVTYSSKRYLREKMAKAYGKRAFQNNKNNNEQIILDLIKLRYKRARLLSYKTHADFVLEERMAENPDTVMQFLNQLLEKALPAAKKEFETLKKVAKKDNIKQIEKWDTAYYTEKLKKEKFAINDELLKPYFRLENVLKGVFEIANKLYGLTFQKAKNIPVYHKDVEAFKVTDKNGDFIAIFYADFFPRKGKRNGAWMTAYKNQWKKKGTNSRPHISIVCNFTKPTDTTPSLLTFREVTTLFHEFGHALHGMLANTTYPSLSGTSVYWDFVELPSQLMENWAYEEEALTLFAKHYKTGKLIPIDLVKKIKESSNFMEGIATLRQLSFGFLDMAWHANNPDSISNVKQYETTAFAKTQLYPDVAENCMSTAFSHIFPGGYSSGYYSYKWAEVLDADAFELFLNKGIFDKNTADKFKENILSKGGTDKPMNLYKKFRGSTPDINALLRRSGLK